MSTLYGVNADLVNDGEGVKIGKGETNGRVRCLYDEHVFAADVNAISDVILMGAKLPAGCRVVGGKVKSDSMGTTGIFKFGYQASDDGSVVADDDAFGTSYDAGGAAVETAVSGAGLGKKLDKAVQPVLTLTEATDSASGDTIKVWLFFVVD